MILAWQPFESTGFQSDNFFCPNWPIKLIFWSILLLSLSITLCLFHIFPNSLACLSPFFAKFEPFEILRDSWLRHGGWHSSKWWRAELPSALRRPFVFQLNSRQKPKHTKKTSQLSTISRTPWPPYAFEVQSSFTDLCYVIWWKHGHEVVVMVTSQVIVLRWHPIRRSLVEWVSDCWKMAAKLFDRIVDHGMVDGIRPNDGEQDVLQLSHRFDFFWKPFSLCTSEGDKLHRSMTKLNKLLIWSDKIQPEPCASTSFCKKNFVWNQRERSFLDMAPHVIIIISIPHEFETAGSGSFLVQ